VRNGGATTWTRALPNPYRLGYRWFDLAGNKYNNEPAIGLRTELPRDLAPGQVLDVGMVLRAPLIPGRYALKIDMVHEGVTWFEDTGQPPLVLHVTVT
jgi:hypothetical protein